MILDKEGKEIESFPKSYFDASSVILISGGFAPIHSGHIAMMRDAKLTNPDAFLIAVVNCDKFLMQKKGFVFQNQYERANIVDSIRWVDWTVILDTDSMYVDEAIRELSPDFFANGGDRSSVDRIPIEKRKAMKEVNCEILFGVGGDHKANSSSWMVENRYIIPELLHSKMGHPATTIQQKEDLMRLAGGMDGKIWTYGWLTDKARIGVK